MKISMLALLKRRGENALWRQYARDKKTRGKLFMPSHPFPKWDQFCADNIQIMNVYECNGTNIFMR